MNRRDAVKMVVDHGFEIIEVGRNCHWRIKARAADGRVCTLSLPTTESDHRALKNKSAQLRKIAEGVM